MMNKLKAVRWNHNINYIVIGIFTLVFGIIALTGGRLNSSLLFLLEKIAISVILAVSLSLVVGFLGELSLGHAGFMCVGAYLGGKVSALLEPVIEYLLGLPFVYPFAGVYPLTILTIVVSTFFTLWSGISYIWSYRGYLKQK